jgi:aspartyl-tRNA(Asn)/glutamyl-tRNA(Gln) amidotransferase subunit A
MKIDLTTLTIKKAHDSLTRGDFTAVELARSYLDNIAAKNKDIHAYLEVFDDALDFAKKADEMIAVAKKAGKDFPMLCGIPFAIKDNILIKGKIASSASKILEDYRATYDATVIRKLQQENGAVFLGRTNMDEFAMGGSTENSAFGMTKNPHDFTRVPGGTSGGSAAAIAANMALAALGSDTGGSIRQPSSFCGVVGLKPTYGAVSRYGLMAAVSSFDQIGPIAKNVEDAEIIFNAIHGKDAHDGTTIDVDTYKPKNPLCHPPAGGGKKKPVIGIPRSFLNMGGINPEVKKAFEAAEKKFKDLGYEIKDIELPANKYALPVYYILNFAEISSNMSRYDGVKYGLHKDGKDGIDDYFETRRAGLGREVIRRILLGTYVLSAGYYDAYYNRANAVRRMITDDFIKAFNSPAGGGRGVDLIITPVAPSPAWKIGEKASDPMAMYLEDIFTVTANLTGMPAMSVPCPRSDLGTFLPIGVQLTARHGDEQTLFEAGKDFSDELE